LPSDDAPGFEISAFHGGKVSQLRAVAPLGAKCLLKSNPIQDYAASAGWNGDNLVQQGHRTRIPPG